MTLAMHTAGPWALDDKTGTITWGDCSFGAAVGAGGFVVASHSVCKIPAHQSERLTAEHRANAHLIVASPQLLAALEAAEGWIDANRESEETGEGQQAKWLLDTIRSAIDQAYGPTVRFQIQVNIGYEWECAEWVEGDENGVTGQRIEATHDTRESAQSELDDLFAGMKEAGMDFDRDDWRVAMIGGAA